MVVNLESYFVGGGLFDYGLKEAGINITKAYEIDSHACKTYRANLGNEIIEGDITKKLALEKDTCDAMAFTYPCNRYSGISAIHGKLTGDDLYLHAFRHVVLKQPDLYVLENVPRMLKFKVVMEAMTQLPNYYVQAFCPVQTTNWLPQERDRLIIFGTKKAFNFEPPKIAKPATLKDILESEPKFKRPFPKAIKARMSGEYRDLPIISDPAKGDIAPLCVAHYSRDKSTRLVKDKRFPMGVRPYTLREYARLQGVPDSFLFPVTDNQGYQQVGNGVPIPIGIWAGQQINRYFNYRRGV